MKYKVVFTDKAKRQLKKIDKYTSSLIIGWLEKNIEGCENPRVHGKGLVENKSGQWRYRIGDYRVICEIQDEKIIVLILEIGHRETYIIKKLTLMSEGTGNIGTLFQIKCANIPRPHWQMKKYVIILKV